MMFDLSPTESTARAMSETPEGECEGNWAPQQLQASSAFFVECESECLVSDKRRKRERSKKMGKWGVGVKRK